MPGLDSLAESQHVVQAEYVEQAKKMLPKKPTLKVSRVARSNLDLIDSIANNKTTNIARWKFSVIGKIRKWLARDDNAILKIVNSEAKSLKLKMIKQQTQLSNQYLKKLNRLLRSTKKFLASQPKNRRKVLVAKQLKILVQTYIDDTIHKLNKLKESKEKILTRKEDDLKN